MAKQTVKEMLICLYKEDREQIRCGIVHKLKKEGICLIETIQNEIKSREKTVKGYKSNINVEEEAIKGCRKEIEDLLINNKLFYFDRKVCGDNLHESLKTFDVKTKEHIKAILESKSGVV